MLVAVDVGDFTMEMLLVMRQTFLFLSVNMRTVRVCVRIIITI